MSQLRRGQKNPDSVAGGLFPPATEHDDGPPERPRRDVPSVDAAVEPPADQKTVAEPEEEADGA